MSWQLDLVEGEIKELKSLTIGVSRGLRDLQRAPGAAQRGKSKPDRRPGDVLLKSAIVELLRPTMATAAGSFIYTKTAGEMVAELYAGDAALHDFVARAAVPPASTTAVGWAAELVSTAVVDFLAGDEPSGFMALAAQCLNVQKQQGASIKVPSRVYPISLVGSWTIEGGAKPVHAIPLQSVTISPSKLACITAWSDELADYAVSTIETLMRDALRHDILGLLDSAAFDSTAASASRPAGLFNGATAVTASTATPLGDAMAKDLAGLASAVATGAPDAKPVYVMNPAQAMRLTLAAPGFGVVTSGYMTAGNVGCVDANSIVTMIDDLRFSASSNVTVNMANPALPIGSAAGTLASPVSSAFQMGLIALRSVLYATWQKRRTGATALCTGVSW